MNTKKWKSIDKINFKRKLKNFCIEIIKSKIEEAATSMERSQEAANSEDKSSMGDKYEITKAMGQIDSDRAGLQFFEGKKQLMQLQLVNVESIYDEIQPGAFVICDEANYFIATGIGGKLIDGEKINIVSAIAPVALQLMHKKAGNAITINNKTLLVKSVF